jgi:hypothetical protein
MRDEEAEIIAIRESPPRYFGGYQREVQGKEEKSVTAKFLAKMREVSSL